MATAKTVIVGCRLPNGIVLEHPLEPTKKVHIKGLNRSLIVGATHAETEVDGEFWEAWKTVHKDFKPLKSGAIFEARDSASAASKAKELKGEKTGFEKTPQKSNGVKPADEKGGE